MSQLNVYIVFIKFFFPTAILQVSIVLKSFNIRLVRRPPQCLKKIFPLLQRAATCNEGKFRKLCIALKVAITFS